MTRDEDEISESQEVPLRPDYKITKGAKEAKEALMGKKKITQDSEPKSAKIVKFM
jgi:hypothetical protein